MKNVIMAFFALIVFLESIQTGLGLSVLSFLGVVGNVGARSIPIGLGIGLALLIPAFLLGADWRAKAMLAEEEEKLKQRRSKWEIF